MQVQLVYYTKISKLKQRNQIFLSSNAYFNQKDIDIIVYGMVFYQNKGLQ